MLYSALKIENRKWERPAVRKQPLKNAAQWITMSPFTSLMTAIDFSSYVPLQPQRRVANDLPFAQCDADLITTVCLCAPSRFGG